MSPPREPAAPASYMGVPPVKEPSWKPGMIPGYLWLGGTAAGAWTAVTLDALVGAGDASLLRTGRHTAAVALAGGTVLLIADLGRPERSLNMLRVYRPRSAMNLGAWGLGAFGGTVGLGVVLELVREMRARRIGAEESARAPAPVDRALQLAGLGPALFVGSYTGTLLSSTSAPAWAERVYSLGPLFAAASASSGIGALLVVAEADRSSAIRETTVQRLARAHVVALAVELLLSRLSDRALPDLPSQERPPADERVLRIVADAAAALGIAGAVRGARAGGIPRRSSIETDALYRRYYGEGPAAEHGDRVGGRARLAAGLLAMAGGLALRFLTTRSGRRSARTAGDTWRHAR